MFVEYKGPLKDTLIEMQQDLQSSISYAGGKKLDAIRTVDYVVVKIQFLMVTGFIKEHVKRRVQTLFFFAIENFLSPQFTVQNAQFRMKLLRSFSNRISFCVLSCSPNYNIR